MVEIEPVSQIQGRYGTSDSSREAIVEEAGSSPIATGIRNRGEFGSFGENESRFDRPAATSKGAVDRSSGL
jgi:hypothetical protein